MQSLLRLRYENGFLPCKGECKKLIILKRISEDSFGLSFLALLYIVCTDHYYKPSSIVYTLRWGIVKMYTHKGSITWNLLNTISHIKFCYRKILMSVHYMWISRRYVYNPLVNSLLSRLSCKLVLIPNRSNFFRTNIGSHPASHWICIGHDLSEVKHSVGEMITHLHRVLKLSMSGSVTPLSHTASQSKQTHPFIFTAYANIKLPETKYNFEIHLERVNKTIQFWQHWLINYYWWNYIKID